MAEQKGNNPLIYWREATQWWDTKEWEGSPHSNQLPYAFKPHPDGEWRLAGWGTHTLPTRQSATEKEAKDALTQVVMALRLTHG